MKEERDVFKFFTLVELFGRKFPAKIFSKTFLEGYSCFCTRSFQLLHITITKIGGPKLEHNQIMKMITI